MKKFKTVLAVLLAAAMILSLVACAGNSSPAESSAPAESKAEESKAEESKPAESSVEESVEESSEEAETATDEKTPLYIWDMTWGTSDNMQLADGNLTAKYMEQNPNVEITWEIKAWDNFMETYSTAIASGTQPDQTTGGASQMGLYHQQGELLDLTPVVDAWKAESNPILDDFNDATLGTFQYSDQLAAMCFGVDAKIIMYRKDFLEESGYTGDLSTIDEFRKALETCKANLDPSITPFIAPGNGTIANHNMSVVLGMFGLGYTDADCVPAMSDEEHLKALTFIQDMWKDGLIGEADAGYQEADGQKAFASGGGVFILGMNTASFRDCDFFDQMQIMKMVEGGVAVNCPNPIYAFCNSANNKVDPQPVYDWIKWWMENSLDYFIESGHSCFPTRASYYENPYYKDEPLRQQCWDYNIAVGYAETYPCAEIYPAYLQVDGEKLLANGFQQLLLGEDVAAVAAEVDAVIGEAIDTYNN